MKRLAIVLSLLNQPYKSMQTVSSIRNNGVIITQEAMSDALEIAGKSNKVMKKYQAERQTYPPRIVRQGEAIYNLLHINGNLSATREEIKNSGINVNSNDWKLISDYLEDCGVECVQDNSKRGRPLNVYQIPLTDSKGAVRTTEFKQIKKMIGGKLWQKNYDKFKSVADTMNESYNHYVATSLEGHHELVKSIAINKLFGVK